MTIEKYRELVHENTKFFNAKDALNVIRDWIVDYSIFSNMKKAVIGISGGKDSTVAAAILARALGKDNVIGLLMPNGEQKDISDSIRVCELLDIKYETLNIKEVFDAFTCMLAGTDKYVSEEARINIAPRIRMTTLYTYGQTNGCRVAGTGNLSERLLGYFTKWGDGASDFNILANFTSLEVMRLGEELGLPLDLVYKTPEDGLSGQSDEEKLGVSYVDVHNYIRNNCKYGYKHNVTEEEECAYNRIERLMNRAQHKLNTNIPYVDYCYFVGDMPELGEVVTAKFFDKNGKISEEKGFIVKTSFYPEGIVFETLNYRDVRLNNLISWR